MTTTISLQGLAMMAKGGTLTVLHEGNGRVRLKLSKAASEFLLVRRKELFNQAINEHGKGVI